MGTLFLVSTPIGNWEDITQRAQKILGEAEIFLVEDTRKTHRLLAKLGLPSHNLISFYDENEDERIPWVLNLLKEGKKVCLLSNAGTPIISDPGYKLVRTVAACGFQIVALPGASAALAALVVSGLPADRFTFLGFLPKKEGKKKKLFEKIGRIDTSLLKTFIFFESPWRLLETLRLMKGVLGNCSVAICRELTKKFEEIIRGRLKIVLLKLEKRKIKGEITVVFSLE